MNAIDILYTPLDTPEVPDTDIEKLLDWVRKHSPVQEVQNRRDASQNANLENGYPWSIIYPRLNSEWQFNFDQEFSELATFFYSAFGLKEEDVNKIIMLPLKSEFTGQGFWHSDPDEHGLRMYIENQEPEDFLLIKPTIEPYGRRPDFRLETNFQNAPLQDKTFSATLKSPTQAFFINNIRGVHAVNTSRPGIFRIAVIISVAETAKYSMRPTSWNMGWSKDLNDFVVKSAEKFKEHAIYWPKPDKK
jgi:hypothetical protein